MELLLAATIDAALGAGVVKPSSLERVTVDITVQPKALAFPTDSRLYHRGREILVRLAARHGVRTAAELSPASQASVAPGQSLCPRTADETRAT